MKIEVTKEWCETMAKLEGDSEIGAGSLLSPPCFLVWSHEHRAWWRPYREGYTKQLDQAGIYSRDDAMEIVDGATLDWTSGLPNELPVRIDDLPERARVLLGVL